MAHVGSLGSGITPASSSWPQSRAMKYGVRLFHAQNSCVELYIFFSQCTHEAYTHVNVLLLIFDSLLEMNTRNTLEAGLSHPPGYL